METARNYYNKQYESWMPWVEDKYLAWFGKNKTSYVAEEKLDKTKITGNENVDKVQDGVNGVVTGQLEKGGLLEGVGNVTSKEAFSRSERGGKDDQGKFI